MKRVAVSVFVLLLCLMNVSSSALVEWPLNEGGNGHYYEVILVPEGIDWQAAYNAANAAGGYLATITSQAENDFVYSLASINTAFWTPGRGETSIGPWLGGFQPDGSPEPDGNWQWVTGVV